MPFTLLPYDHHDYLIMQLQRLGGFVLVLGGLAAAQFNASFQYTLDLRSPALGLLSTGRLPWIYDEETGCMNSPQAQAGAEEVSKVLEVVTSRYIISGEVTTLGGATTQSPTELLGWITAWGDRGMEDDEIRIQDLSESSGLLLNWSQPDAAFTRLHVYVARQGALSMHNVTIELPVHTQAYVGRLPLFTGSLRRPSSELWEEQATYFPAVTDGKPAPGMSLGPFSSGDVWTETGAPWASSGNSDTASSPIVQIEGDSVLLANLTELTFEPPANTSLIRILGPSGADAKWTTSDHLAPEHEDLKLNLFCTLLLDPMPDWIFRRITPTHTHFPLASFEGPVFVPNLTHFLIPLDPTVNYKVTVLPQNNKSVCVTSGIKTYSFYL